MNNQYFNLKRLFFAGLSLLGILAILFGSLSCASKNDVPIESLSLATLPLEASSLILVADNQGYFSQNFINVQFKYYDTGLGTLNALLKGEADLAAPVGEYVLVGKIFGDERVMTVGAIDKSDYQVILGRKDHGIADVKDLRGKRLGVIRGTQEEFYLTRFLELQSISLNEITLVDVPLSQSVDAIVSGNIDAGVMVPPYIDDAIQALGNHAVAWSVQANQTTQQLVICQSEWITQHTALIKRFLKSLSIAQDYLIHNPDQAKAIIKKRLNLPDKDVTRIWSQNQFGLSLDLSLIAAMEDEARWMIKNNLTTEKQVPFFNDYIYEDALKAIKPEAVNIIR
jgi:NitT/TauT family transport system substrate-binding protein